MILSLPSKLKVMISIPIKRRWHQNPKADCLPPSSRELLELTQCTKDLEDFNCLGYSCPIGFLCLLFSRRWHVCITTMENAWRPSSPQCCQTREHCRHSSDVSFSILALISHEHMILFPGESFLSAKEDSMASAFYLLKIDLKFRLGWVQEQEHLVPVGARSTPWCCPPVGATQDKQCGVDFTCPQGKPSDHRIFWTFGQKATFKGVTPCVFWIQGWHFILTWVEAMAKVFRRPEEKKNVFLSYNWVLLGGSWGMCLTV